MHKTGRPTQIITGKDLFRRFSQIIINQKTLILTRRNPLLSFLNKIPRLRLFGRLCIRMNELTGYLKEGWQLRLLSVINAADGVVLISPISLVIKFVQCARVGPCMSVRVGVSP